MDVDGIRVVRARVVLFTVARGRWGKDTNSGKFTIVAVQFKDVAGRVQVQCVGQ